MKNENVENEQRPRVTISLESAVLDEVETRRGMVPRSAFINKILRDAFAGAKAC